MAEDTSGKHSEPTCVDLIKTWEQAAQVQNGFGLEPTRLRPLFGDGPQGLFAGAARTIKERDAIAFNHKLKWLTDKRDVLILESELKQMLAITAAAIYCVTSLAEEDDSEDLATELMSAIRQLDGTWKNTQPVGCPNFITSFMDKRPRLKAIFSDQKTSLASWYAWDILLGLHQDETLWSGIPFQTAAAPVLFVDEANNQGLVALLTIELLQDGGSGFTPIPESLGLTALNPEFHSAMQRAWMLSGIQGWRGRWKLSQFPTSTGTLDVPLLSGRSLEAATCATLWSAYGCIPGTDQTTPDPPIKSRTQPFSTTDLRTAITAQLGDLPKNGKRDEIPLAPITGLVSKYKAARDAELEVVIVAKEQEPKATEGWTSSQAARLGPPTRLPTIGKAWDWIHADVRFLRAYQAKVVETWRQQWIDEVDVLEDASETSPA